MTLRSDVKFRGKLTCGWNNDMRNLVNFHVGSLKSLKYFISMGSFCQKYTGLCR